jgi:hypothetical protein
VDRSAKLTLDQGANNLGSQTSAYLAVNQALAVVLNSDQELLLLALRIHRNYAAAVC